MSAPYFWMSSSGCTEFPLLLDIFTPPLVIIPWVKRRLKGSSKLMTPIVLEDLRDEPGIKQMKDGVLHPADILVHGKPVIGGFGVEGGLVVFGGDIAQEIPAGIHESIHGVRFPPGLRPAFGASGLHEGRDDFKGILPWA